LELGGEERESGEAFENRDGWFEDGSGEFEEAGGCGCGR
jgi:hypothetical protein